MIGVVGSSVLPTLIVLIADGFTIYRITQNNKSLITHFKKKLMIQVVYIQFERLLYLFAYIFTH